MINPSKRQNITKKNQHILLFSPFFYPELISTGKYNTYLAKELVRSGCSVDVISFHPIYPEWKPKRSKDSLKGMHIHRGGLFIQYPESMILRRIILEIGFALYSIRKVIFKRNKDIVIPVFPPIIFFFFINLFIAGKTRKIGIVHDLLSVMAEFSGKSPKKLMMKIIRYFEKKVFSSCDKLVFVSESMASTAISEYGIDPKKVFVSYPFVSLDVKSETNDLGEIFPAGFKHIVYSGALGAKQNPFILAEFFERAAKKRGDIICHIFSSGPVFKKLKKKYLGSKRILFHDLVPEENLYELYMRSDVQIIPQIEGSSNGAIPSKLPNVLSAGVPIFAITDSESEVSKIIRKSGIGYCSDSWDIEKLVNELDEFIEVASAHSHNERREKYEHFLKNMFGIDKLKKEIY